MQPGRPSPGNTTLLAVITNQKRLGRAVKPFVGTLSEKTEQGECARAQRSLTGHLRIGLPVSGIRCGSRNPCENRGKTAAFKAYSGMSQCCKPRGSAFRAEKPPP